MNITPLSLSVPLAGAAAAPPPPVEAPRDAFTPGAGPAAAAADRLRAAARVLTRKGRLDKSEVKYRVAAWSPGPGGGCYVAYKSEWPGTRGYLARVERDGRVAWELPLEDGKVAHLSVSGDGSRVLVGTSSGRLAVTAGGEVARAEVGAEEVRSHHEDRTGLHLETLSADGSVRAFTADGRPVALPEATRELNVRTVEPAPDGGLLLVGRERAVRLAPGGGLSGELVLPRWPAAGQTTFDAHRVWPAADGGYLVEKRAYTMITPRGPHRFMRPGFGGGFGGHFDPDHYMPETFTRTRLLRLDETGAERWSTDDLGGDEFRPLVLRDGTAFFAGGQAEKGQAGVRRLDAEGRVTTAFQVPGTVSGLVAGSTPGSVLVVHGDSVTRFSSEGQRTAGLSLAGERQGYRLEGDLPDGRLVFQDGRGALLWSWDPTTGQWTRLTDPDGDHSLRLDEITDAPAEPPGRVEETEDWVIIGDVGLPRNE